MDRFYYDGPVFIFDECADRRFVAKTMAVSEQKARSNLTYQWKVRNGLPPRSNVRLTGPIRKDV